MPTLLPAQPLNNLNDICYMVMNVPRPSGATILKVHLVGGTAFYAGLSATGLHVFLTASHVITQMKDARDRYTGGVLALGAVDGQAGRPLLVFSEAEEIIESHDVGIIMCRAPIEAILRFPVVSSGDLPSLMDVFTAGYPDAVDAELNIVTARSYKGYVVATRRLTRFGGHPRCYELSFPAPRGLSGAPLMTILNDQPMLAGMILGVEKSRYHLVGETVEESETGGAVVRTVTEEAVFLTIALQSAELMSLRSEVLQCNLGDLLWTSNYCLQVFD